MLSQAFISLDNHIFVMWHAFGYLSMHNEKRASSISICSRRSECISSAIPIPWSEKKQQHTYQHCVLGFKVKPNLKCIPFARLPTMLGTDFSTKTFLGKLWSSHPLHAPIAHGQMHGTLPTSRFTKFQANKLWDTERCLWFFACYTDPS